MYFSKQGALCVIMLCTLTYALDTHLETSLAKHQSNSVEIPNLPLQIGPWVGQDTSSMKSYALKILQLDSYIQRIYKHPDGRQVFVYVGYWKKQSGEHQAAKHSPLLCLPGNGWTVSRPIETTVLLDNNKDSILTTSKLLAEYRETNHLFYYWFFSGDKSYHKESRALLEMVYQTFVHQRSDGGIVEITTPVTAYDNETDTARHTERTIEEFIREFYPKLKNLISY